MNFANYVLSWSGRIGRLQWWLGGLVQAIMLLAVVASVALATSGNDTGGGVKRVALMAIAILLLLLTLWFGIGLSVKRLHDHNKSGWWFFAYFIPVLGFIWQVIECGLLRGSDGPNDYGPDPRFRFNVSEDIEALIAQRDRQASGGMRSPVLQATIASPVGLSPAVASRPVFGKRV
jgi:uncharacterized membrane protein YhaH (DUF805 family)